jgi:hypothetical protein
MNIKAGAVIHAGDGGYSEGTQEGYNEFVDKRNQSLGKMRILELMDQAGIDVEAVENLGEMPTALKFAALIVKEYEKLLPEICPWADADKEGPMKGWHVQFVARKHFGVEE